MFCNLSLLIKTITTLSNVIGYQQPDLNSNRRVYASCLLLDSIVGQLARHACGIGQYPSCCCVLVGFNIVVLIVAFFMNTYNQRLGCFFNSVIVLINLQQDIVSSNSFPSVITLKMNKTDSHFAIVRFSESLI